MTIDVGWTREDEDGWREIISEEEDGFWVQDKHGAETFLWRDTFRPEEWKAPR